MQPYTFHTDVGHGWLEVPVQEVKDLGIGEDISGYSYISDDWKTVYLEEDCDAQRFIDAKLEKHKVKITWVYEQHNDDCFIRRLNNIYLTKEV